MSSQYITLYKMIVLYMLMRSDVPLSKSQIYDFMLEEGYTTFMTLQEAFSELSSSGLINETTVANRTYLEITAEGEQSLEFFGNRINPAIREQVDDYLRENSIRLRDESSVLGDYRKVGENEYVVRLWAKEKYEDLIDIRIPVPTEQMAQKMLEEWKEKNQEIYKYLYDVLLGERDNGK
ncbi:MAG: DUF4364 family protein [Butyrivibrio sp.]|nr:DUF4364 family protein [Butyrivibrio sp.]